MAGDSRKIKAGEAYIEANLDDGPLRRRLRNLSQTMGRTLRSAGVAIGRVLSVGIASGIAAGAVLMRSAIQKAVDQQLIETAFETMLGSAEEARLLIDRLTKLGAKTPFETADLLKSAQTLLNFGASAEEAFESVKMLSDIAAGDAQKLSSLALVFGQIRSAGKLTGGDLLQLINVGFNPLLSISEKTGESMAELRDRMSKGNVTFEEVKQAFIDATSEGGRFFQMNEKMSETVAGRWATLNDAWSALLLNIGTASLPAVEKATSYLENLAENAEYIVASLKSVWTDFGSWFEAFWRSIFANILDLYAGFFDTIRGGLEMVAKVNDRLPGGDKIAEVFRASSGVLGEFANAARDQAKGQRKAAENALMPIFEPLIKDIVTDGIDDALPSGGTIRGPVEAQKPTPVIPPSVAASGTFSGRAASFLGKSDPVVTELKDANKKLANIERNTREGGMTFA